MKQSKPVSDSSTAMSSITPRTSALTPSPTKQPLERRRKQKQTIIHQIVILSCILLLGRNNSVVAVESSKGSASTASSSRLSTSRRFPFLRKTATPLIEQRNMRTRSGLHYRGGSTQGDPGASSDGDSVPTTTEVPAAASALEPSASAAVTDASGSDGTTASTKKPFSWKDARNTLFPIHGDETRKFLLIGAIKFFIIMALTLTRDTKDTLVVTQCGAEAIAFLKVSNSTDRLDCRVNKFLFSRARSVSRLSRLF